MPWYAVILRNVTYVKLFTDMLWSTWNWLAQETKCNKNVFSYGTAWLLLTFIREDTFSPRVAILGLEHNIWLDVALFHWSWRSVQCQNVIRVAIACGIRGGHDFWTNWLKQPVRPTPSRIILTRTYSSQNRSGVSPEQLDIDDELVGPFPTPCHHSFLV